MKHQHQLEDLLASIRAGLYLQQQRRARAEARQAPAPFVTVSRQAGAGGRTLGRALADRLTALGPSDRPWSVWDRELVEKVSTDEHIPVSLVESLEADGPRRSTFQDFLASLSARNDAADLDEFQVYRRVARTVRALARAGRAVLVGRGGVYATSDLPGGVHVRLVAPLQDRVANMARILNVSEAHAADEVRRIDRYRDTFHRRYWPDQALLPEIFTVTLNTARLDDQAMAECILPLIPTGSASGPPTAPRADAPGARVVASAQVAR